MDKNIADMIKINELLVIGFCHCTENNSFDIMAIRDFDNELYLLKKSISKDGKLDVCFKKVIEEEYKKFSKNVNDIKTGEVFKFSDIIQ